MKFLRVSAVVLLFLACSGTYADKSDISKKLPDLCADLCKSVEDGNKLNETEHNKYIKCRSEQKCGEKFETNQTVGFSGGAAAGGLAGAVPAGILFFILLLIVL